MKIALYHNLSSGGARRAMVEMVRGLAARGHVVDEYCPETADLTFLPLDAVTGRQVVLPFRPRGVWRRRAPLLTPYVTAARLAADLRQLAGVNRRAAELIDAEDYDVVFSHDCRLAQNPAVLRYLKTPALHYCHHGGGPHLIAPHLSAPGGADRAVAPRMKRAFYTLPRASYPWLVKREATRNIRAARVVAGNSRFAVEGLYRVYGVQGRLCYLGVDARTFRPLGLRREDFVLSVGAVHYHKGYRFLVAALGRIPAGGRPALLIAANSVEAAEEEVVESIARQHGVSLSIRRVMDDEELVRLYNRAAAFVYAPIMEPWGLTAVEAMACGAPVAAVAEGGVRESVVHSETGWLVERDEAQFAEAVSSLLADRAMAGRMGEAGVARARSEFAWTRTVDRLEELLRGVVGS